MSSVETILIVDDESLNRNLLSEILKPHYNLILAKNGEQAMERIESNSSISLVLLDVIMPDLDGISVCRMIKKGVGTGDIPIIFLSSESDTKRIVEGFEAGGADYIKKPFEKLELLARIKTHLALKKAQDDLIDYQKNSAVAAMAVTANHEINQPLAVALASYEMLEKFTDSSLLQEKQITLHNRIKSSLEAINQIVKNYADPTNFDFVKYSDGVDMVRFKKKECIQE